MPTPLEEKIRQIIRLNGPISVSDYFSLCLADPELGYYKTQNPFGTDGDFITAPEISQLFGEMLAAYLIQAWQVQNPHGPVRLVEIGPGRGTLMADILRVIGKLAPGLANSMTIHLVETSEKLRDEQAATLKNYASETNWHDDFQDVPDGFTLLVANELFDAVPIRQFVKTDLGFRERMVSLDEHNILTFTTGVAGLDPELLPTNHKDKPIGTILEVAPARANIMSAIAERIKACGGSALIIDYGHLTHDFGDSLQAVFRHEYDPPLAHPGLADLTSHVDFETLMRVAYTAGAHIHGVMHQGDFLVGLGLLERAGALGANQDKTTQEQIRSAVERLAGYGEGNMGELFKVLAISGTPVQLAPFIVEVPDAASGSDLN